MSKKLIMPLAICATGLVAMAVLVMAKPKPVPQGAGEEPSNIQVAVTPARQESIRLSVNAQGTVTPKREIDLIAQVSGQVMSVEPSFVDGGFFETSQILIRIDDRDYRSALLAAKARVAEAEQRLAEEGGLSRQAQREWRDLGNQNANDLFLRKPQLAAAKANLESAKGALAMAELNLERTRISVPFNGRIRQTHVDLGQYVTLGSQLATVYDSTVVEVRLPLTEAQASLIDLPFVPSTDANPIEPIPVTITGSVAGAQHQWQGLLTRTDAFVDADSRMYYAVVEVSEPFVVRSASEKASAPLLPGLFVEADIAGKKIDDVLQLPRAALFGRDKLLTLDNDNKIVEQKVKVLRRSDTEVWVQVPIEENVLISLEKQSLTPSGTIVEPLLGSADSVPVALTAAPAVSATDVPAHDHN